MKVSMHRPTLLAFAAVPLVVAATSATALEDTKITNGASCQPYRNTTSQTDLAYRPAGVTNVSSTDEWVVCNIIVDVDATSAWTAAAQAQINVIMYNAGSAIPYCRVYIGSSLTGTATSETSNLSSFSGTTWTTNFYVDATGVEQVGQPGPVVSLYCKLPPNVTLTRIWVTENSATDEGA